jgi:hypothetical protein
MNQDLVETDIECGDVKEGQELKARMSIYDIYEIKRKSLTAYTEMERLDKEISSAMEEINDYDWYDFRMRDCGEAEKQVDKKCWRYLMRIFDLRKFMLCTEYDKASGEIESGNFPVFNIENAESWLLGLKSLVYENVQRLIEDVFNRITQETYRVGGWNGTKKKRNNNGIDKFFILSTGDNYAMEWYSSRSTITDDLEKACYIIDGKQLPEQTIREAMRRGKIWESSNPYFRIRVCKNGNTHYWIDEKIREKLNLYGSRKNIIGENIKIKIFEGR